MLDINYIEGDLFQPIIDEIKTITEALDDKKIVNTYLIPHVCNNKGVMGAGFVVPLAKHFPKAREMYLDWSKGSLGSDTYGGSEFGLGRTQAVVVCENPKVIVLNMVAQDGTGGVRPLRYNALSACMDHVYNEWAACTNAEIRAPLFGSGLSGGNWNFIAELIKDCWVKQFVPVSVYYMNDKVPAGWMPSVQK